MEEKEKIVLTDNQGMIQRGTTLFKVKHKKGVKLFYEEIDLEEYDKRIGDLANKIAKMPGVDMLAILKDALYDMTLDHLSTVEERLEKELKKAEPKVKTITDRTFRGTCVNLAIGGRVAVELRH